MTRQSRADPVIREWAAHWSRTRQLAAVLARELASHPDHSRIEPGKKIAALHGVSYTTAVRARNLLIGIGLVYKDGPHYYKASTGNGKGR